MTSEPSPLRIVGIAGSLRAQAHSAAVLQTLAEAAPAHLTVTPFPLQAVPLYNADLDTDAPPQGVADFKAAIAAADGLVVVTPEYNYGIPGVLKNAIDWASRPGFASPLKDKPALIVSTSPGALGGARAHAQVREALSAALARVVARPQITIAGVADKIRDGRLTDEAHLGYLLRGLADLEREVRLLQAAT
jgi:chromate reductase, NAD(P)H dehydrogenase (quinone)